MDAKQPACVNAAVVLTFVFFFVNIAYSLDVASADCFVLHPRALAENFSGMGGN